MKFSWISITELLETAIELFFYRRILPNFPAVSLSAVPLESQAENAASDAAFARRPLEVALETAVEDSGCGVMLRVLRVYLVVYFQRVYIHIDISSTYILQDLGMFHGIFRMGLVAFHFPLLQKGV